jgi:hypothetical protein
MIDSKLLGISLCSLPGVIVFVELFLLLPVTKRARAILKDVGKAMSVMKSPKISDNWKEKALRRYSQQVMASSLAIAFFLVILFLGFAGSYCIFGLLFIGDLNEVIGTFSRLEMQIVTVVLGMLYAFLRNRITKSKAKTDTDYTFSSKLLHHIALDISIVKEMAFDIDCMMTKMQPAQPKVSSPVYIAGLARAGTTILLEALYSTGAFTTLTYRDMPLVTAPYLWSKITKEKKITEEAKKERAHGDNLYVNYDSPEAFEEVFWMTFSNATYVNEDHLEVQDVDDELVGKYKKYVGNIIARHGTGGSVRYLAKNNNNLMRIDTIKSAFPDAIVIVPFRNPINHAKSLHIQHERFLKRHAEDAFSRKYMNWLGHFEFGASFKPLKVHQDALPVNKEEPAKLYYWLRYWKSVYEYLMERHASNALYFNYDKFCEQPEKCLARLESELLLAEGLLKRFSINVRPAKKHLPEAKERLLPPQVKDVYDKLQKICI